MTDAPEAAEGAAGADAAPSLPYGAVEWHGEQYKVNVAREWPAHVALRMRGIEVVRTPHVDPEAYARGGVQRRYGGNTPEIIVFGDSHALMWAQVLDDAARDLVAVVADVVELGVGDRPKRRADVVGVHPDHEAQERAGPGQRDLDVLPLIRDRRAIDLHEPDVVGP